MSEGKIIGALPAGTVLTGGMYPYRIVKPLGQGGFGITYLATAKITVGNIPQEAKFAIKEHFDQKLNQRRGTEAIVSNPLTEKEIHESIDSFMVEAKRLHELHHLNIVPVNECFKANNTAYYVMQYIEGDSLAEMVRQAPTGRLPENLSISIIKKVAEAIVYLHSIRMTHLDVKPENVVMQNWSIPILIDFGLVKRYDSKGRPTTTNKAAGISDGYAPLEQYAGITTFTPEADIYALAATLLFMLTGKTPYKAGEMKAEIIESWLTGVASTRVIRAIVHAMAELKKNRTHSVKQFIEELELGEIIIGPDDGNGNNGSSTEDIVHHEGYDGNNGGSTKPTKKIPQNPHPTPWDKIIKIGCAAIAILFGFIFALLFMLSMIGSCEEGDNAVEISDTIKSDSIVIDSPVKKGDEDNPSKPVKVIENKPNEIPAEKPVKQIKEPTDAEKLKTAINSGNWSEVERLGNKGVPGAADALAHHYLERDDDVNNGYALKWAFKSSSKVKIKVLRELFCKAYITEKQCKEWLSRGLISEDQYVHVTKK